MTFRSYNTKTKIDYFLIRTNNRMLCKDLKVIPSELWGTQRRLLIMDAMIKGSKMKMRKSGNLELDGEILLDKTLAKYQRGLKQKGVGSL